MGELSTLVGELPPEQQAIRGKCFHPSGVFVEFKKEELQQSIPARFEQQVAKYPNCIAVKTGSHTLTYHELNGVSNRVARAILAQRGEGNEPIALVLEHGVAVIVGILGVLKAGKIYVPLDPSYPLSRTKLVLENSQAGVIVTNNANLSLAHELAQDRSHVLNIDTLDSSISAENLGLPISPDNFAWILYTSGSTGQPKGVVQNHRNVLHEVMNYTNVAHICADDRLLLVSSLSFADAVRTTYAGLLNGAGLYPMDIKKEGLAHLANWLNQREITLYRSVPTLFRHFASTLTGKEEFSNLRLIYLAGDSVSKIDVELYKKHFHPNCILVNGLGSTESLTFRWYFIDKKTTITGSNVPVGHPVQDKEVFLLDEEGKRIGVDRVGEIAVKSRYLCPGYWRRPDLTHAAFPPHPEGGDERIYLTGDMGRMSPDGCLEHLGRKDFQIKIRGYRIEASEIEMALRDHAAIKEAVVVDREEEQSGDRRLVAYLVPTKHQAPNVSELRSFLKEKLPDYMVPSAFVFLDALPLTLNGKVDRRALPIPDGSRPELQEAFVAPRTPLEEALARIWAEVLKLERVGIHDNFFELGGHSLLVTQVISRVRTTLQVELPLRALFENPTAASLAVQIAQTQAKRDAPEEMADVLADLESLSDEEAQRLLAQESPKEI